MLVFRPISRGQADYYLDGPAQGQWLGSGCVALGLSGPVVRDALSAALAGRRPDGSALLERFPPNRRAGYDLVLAAPKSFSLLCALAPAEQAARLLGAHAAAVEDVAGYVERIACGTRRRGAQVAGKGLVAARFDHLFNWAGEPHVHTHLVVANLVQGPDGRWSCLDRLKLGRETRSAGAVYHASLRHHVAAAGLAVGWTVRENGLSDVAGVPRAAIEACSTRRRQLTGDRPDQQQQSARTRSVAAGRSRRSTLAAAPPAAADRSVDGSSAPSAGTWERRAAASGLDRDTVAILLAGPRPSRGPGPGDVERLLTTTRSSFSRSELIAVLAATTVDGASSAGLERQADRLLAGAIRVGRRWTTPRVRQLEVDIVRAATGRGGGDPASAGVAPPAVVADALSRRPDLTATQQAAVVRLTTGGAVVDILEPAPLIRSADLLLAASAAWRASGHRVAVVTTTATDRRRWAALADLPGPPDPPARASVTVVDRADRLSTSALHALVDDAARRGAKVVLLPGGTGRPGARSGSPALDVLVERLGPVLLGPDQVDPTRAGRAATAGRDHTVVVAPTAADVVRRLLDDWQAGRSDALPPAMVALGPDEAEHLNRLARSRLVRSGDLSGPALQAGGRELQVGDEVRVLRRVPRLGLPVGMTGVVTHVDLARGQAVLQWPERATVATVASLAGRWWAHAYATTPAYLRHDAPGPVIALGRPSAWDPGRAGLTSYIVVPEQVGRRDGPEAVHQLVASLDPPARTGPCPVGPTLAALADQQARVDRAGLAGCPPDVRAELRLVEEDRAWRRAAHGSLSSVGVTGPAAGDARLTELERRHDHLVRRTAPAGGMDRGPSGGARAMGPPRRRCRLAGRGADAGGRAGADQGRHRAARTGAAGRGGPADLEAGGRRHRDPPRPLEPPRPAAAGLADPSPWTGPGPGRR